MKSDESRSVAVSRRDFGSRDRLIGDAQTIFHESTRFPAIADIILPGGDQQDPTEGLQSCLSCEQCVTM